MSERTPTDSLDEKVRLRASDWFARMRGPDAAELREEFESWRTSDPAHAAAYERLLHHWERTAFLKNTKLAQDRDLSRIDRRPRRRRYAAAACGTVACLGAAALYMVEAPGQLSARSLHLQIVTGDLQGRVVSLDDDTRISVSSRSALELSFDSTVRRAKLSRGRARFEVPRADPRPLIVEAVGGRIVAGRSTFDVTTDPHGTEVATLEGSIEIAGGMLAQGAERRIEAGETVLLPYRAPHVGTTEASPQAATTMLIFQSEALSSALERFNLSARRRVLLADPALGRRRISGAFRADDPVGFAHAVGAMFGCDVVDPGSGPITIASRGASAK